MTASARPFRSVADAYARFRPGYDPAIVNDVLASCGVHDGSVVLDFGCGPGTLAIMVAPRAGRVVALDPEPDMLTAGEAAAAARGVANIEWLAGTVDELDPDRHRFDVALLGQSLHWTSDPVGVLRRLRELAASDASVAILCEIADARDAFAGLRPADVLKAVAREFVSALHPPPPLLPMGDWGDALRTAGWPLAEHRTWPLTRRECWDADAALGNLYVSALGLHDDLGAARSAFEDAARGALLAARPTSGAVVTSQVHAWIATSRGTSHR